MVRQELTDFTLQKEAIINHVTTKQTNGLFNQNLHDIFNKGRKRELRIQDLREIIDAIELKLREVEIIYYTFFGEEYQKEIIIHGSLLDTKVIETEFSFHTRIIKNRIEIRDANMYKETIDMKFQVFVLTTASLYENIVRLIETLLKKKVLFGLENPYQSIHLKILVSCWDNLIDLNYRKNDEFYSWLINHRDFLNKYLSQINSLRNSFIHGYSINLNINVTHNEYEVKNFDTSSNGFQPSSGDNIIPELVVNNFVRNVLTNTKALTENLLNLLQTKLAHHRTKVPI